MKSRRLKLGKKAEDIAVDYLTGKGLKVVKRNFRLREGEIDIIAKDGNTFVFVEVKAKTGINYGLPEEMVGRHKQRKIIRTAELYLYMNLVEDADWRIDVVTVRPKSRSKSTFEVEWIKNAVSR